MKSKLERTKLSSSIDFERTYQKNDIHRRFSIFFTEVLREQAFFRAEESFDAGYVPNTVVEDYLKDFSESGCSEIVFFLGETGSGKSTYLANYFELRDNPVLRNGVLHIPFLLNTYNLGSPTATINRVKDKLRATVKVLVEEAGLEYDSDELYDFIASHKLELLTSHEDFESLSKKDIIKDLRGKNAIAYHAELIKFLITKTDKVSRLIILLDDLESQSTDIQVEVIKSLYHLHSCLQNASKQAFLVNFLISCRPITRQMLRTKKNRVWASAFESTATEFWLKYSVSLFDVFTARFNYYAEIQKKGIKKIDSFEEAVDYMNNIFPSLKTVGFENILEHNNYNFRQSIHDLNKVLTNRRYVQGNEPRQPSFKLPQKHFRLDPVTIHKALLLGENNVFQSDESSILNPFVNRKSSDTDFCLLFLCLWILNVNRDNSISLRKRPLEDAYKAMEGLRYSRQSIDHALSYLEDREAIFIEKITRHGKKKGKKWLFAGDKVSAAFRILSENSIYTEVYREDVYIPNKYLPDIIQKLPFSKVRVSDRYLIGFSMLHWLSDKVLELQQYLSQTHINRQNWFKENFGLDNPAVITFTGIGSSLFRQGIELGTLNDDCQKIIEKVRKTEEWYAI